MQLVLESVIVLAPALQLIRKLITVEHSKIVIIGMVLIVGIQQMDSNQGPRVQVASGNVQ
jgi:hypothetical protein